jgi:glycosyltransferase involved in cell wall biosynthesis
MQTQKVLKRIDQYSNALVESSGPENKVIVFTKAKKSPELLGSLQLFPYLRIYPSINRTFGSFRLVYQLMRHCILHYRFPVLLVAGDPWVDSFIAVSLKKLLWWIQIEVQMSVHGDLINQEKSIFKRWAKGTTLKSLLKESDTVRVVSEHLRRTIIDDFGVTPAKIFVSPIPVALPELDDSIQGSKEYVAFIGRLHYERGLDEFLEIVENLERLPDVFKYLIVGDGPDRNRFLSELTRIVGTENFVFRGLLNEVEMGHVWKDCKVLLSTAPAEGYGLAIRESLLHGTFVVALENSGIREARNEFSYGLHVYKNVAQATALISRLMKENFSLASIEQTRILVAKSNMKSINNLVSSWRGKLQFTEDIQDSN